MSGRLDGRVAIVTGGGHGIGKAYCQGLADAGARVVVAEIDAAAAAATAEEVRRQGGEALAVTTDVASESSTLAMATETLGQYGRIDILINNASVFATVPMSRVPLEELGVEEWDRLMAVNLRGLFLCCKAVLPAMKRQGSGKIINISSGTVFGGSPTRIHYVTSKAGVLGFTRCLAREVGPHGITVNAVAPGSTLSEQNPTEAVLQMRAETAQDRALRRVEVPADLVGAILFFSSPDSDFVTGQTLIVDGGANMN